MKTLILMRHGQAELYAQTDGERALTAAGRQKAAQTALTLQKAALRPDLLLASPLKRAQETAQIAGEVLNVPVITAPELDGRLSAQGLLEFARAQFARADRVMLVGHNPNVSLAAGVLYGDYFPFSAGAYAAFDWTEEKSPKLISRSKHDDI